MSVSSPAVLTSATALHSGNYIADETKAKEKTVGKPIDFTSACNPPTAVKPPEITEPTKQALSPKEQLVLDISKEQLGKYLDTEIKDGMLIITANKEKPSVWNVFVDLANARRMSTIKSELGLEDEVIGKHNPDVYDRYSDSIRRGYNSTPNDGVLQEGCKIRVPVNEVGKCPNWFQRFFGTFDDLK